MYWIKNEPNDSWLPKSLISPLSLTKLFTQFTKFTMLLNMPLKLNNITREDLNAVINYYHRDNTLLAQLKFVHD
jgi:hypothetical protein